VDAPSVHGRRRGHQGFCHQAPVQSTRAMGAVMPLAAR
jgi:hypothetical protein